MTLPGAGKPSSLSPPRRGGLLILGLALAVMVPELVAGLTVSDSSWYDFAWSEQFTALVRQGSLYPRWLPHAWAGLGSPTFYFYPPLFFWVTALVDLLTFGLLPGAAPISLASAVVLAASGFAMRGWLRGLTDDRAALAGAIAYMIAPYHIYDIYPRGALAEACGYALLPVVLIAMRRICAMTGRSRARGMAWLALGYAGLILAHLPTALLTSIVVLPAYALWKTRYAERPLSALAAMAGGAGLGLILAALYLVPALNLLPYISTEALAGAYYRPEAFFLIHPERWANAARMIFVTLASIAILLLGLAGAIAARRSPKGREGVFWGIVAMAVIMLLSGLLPWFWQIPLIARAQFPWRLLLAGEFAVITCLAIGRPALRRPLTLAGAFAVILSATIMLLVIPGRLGESWRTGEASYATIRSEYRDAPEYLPPGLPLPADANGVPYGSLVALPRGPLALLPPGASGSATGGADGSIDLAISAPRTATVTLHRFWFPSWQLTQDGVPIWVRRADRDGLVAFDAAPGAHRYRLVQGAAPGERLALGMSLAAALALAAIFAMTRDRPRGTR